MDKCQVLRPWVQESEIHGVYNSEADVFAALDLEYVAPEDRSI